MRRSAYVSRIFLPKDTGYMRDDRIGDE